ncbi:MAG: sugar ABC transporter permease [Chloroflexota bacterium]|nr:sugar ABC transporter permease [Chloroflexota bacterium]
MLTFTYPTLQAFWLSLNTWGVAGGSEFVGLQQYAEVLNDKLFWVSMKNTFVLALLSVPLTMALAILAAVLFHSASNFPFRNLFRAIYFLPVITSAVAVGFVWSWIFQPDIGLLNALLEALGIKGQMWLSSPSQALPSLAIMNIWMRLGFDMIIFWAGLQGIPSVYYDAAKVDGAGAVARFRHITFPLLNPQIVLVAVIEIINALKVFDLVFIATSGGPVNSTRVVVLHIYDLAFSWNKMGEASAVAICLFVIVIIVTVAQWKLLSRRVEY